MDERIARAMLTEAAVALVERIQAVPVCQPTTASDGRDRAVRLVVAEPHIGREE
jgi:hypothetical protein